MPLSDDEIEAMNGYFEGRGIVTVLVGPCSGRGYTGEAILLDGHHYRCGGQIILHNLKKFRACLFLRTHTFEFLEGAWCRVGKLWYDTEEPAFLEDLK